MNSISTRLKFFRNAYGISQMQLELEIDAAFGSISRIEAGKVNPTKETILKIAKVLKLSDREIDYLIGPTSSPATLSELYEAQIEISNYFHKMGVIAYLVDDRYRLIAYSDSFAKLLNISKEQQSEILYKTLPELLLDTSYATARFFSNDLTHNITLLLSRFINEMGFMQDDPYYIKIIDIINNHPQAKDIWNKLHSKKDRISVFSSKDRYASFKVLGHEFKLHYSNEPLQKYKRFDVVEYIPDDWFLRVFAKMF